MLMPVLIALFVLVLLYLLVLLLLAVILIAGLLILPASHLKSQIQNARSHQYLRHRHNNSVFPSRATDIRDRGRIIFPSHVTSRFPDPIKHPGQRRRIVADRLAMDDLPLAYNESESLRGVD